MLYNFCDSAVVRPAICGPNKVYQVNSTSNDTFEVKNMQVADSCTFKVFGKCASPVFTVNSVDVNVFVASFKGKDTEAGSDIAKDGALTLASKKNGKTVATVSDSVNGNDCNSQRRMYVTLTRVQPKAQGEQMTSRMLQTPGIDLKIQLNSASFYTASLLIVASAILSIIAF